jgi:hypothetical protein
MAQVVKHLPSNSSMSKKIAAEELQTAAEAEIMGIHGSK